MPFSMKKDFAVSVKKEITSHEFYSEKLKNLKYYREVVRDGNCLYTSLSVQLLDFFRNDKNKIEIWNNFCNVLSVNCEKLGIEELVYCDNIDTFNDLLSNNVKFEEIDIYAWYEIIYIFRLAISTHIRLNAEEFQPFIVNMTVEKYCKNYIEPFYMEAGYIEIGALVNILPISIEVLDISEKNEDCSRIYGIHKDCITILHTPNHFEPVYYA